MCSNVSFHFRSLYPSCYQTTFCIDYPFKTNTNTITLVKLTIYVVLHMKPNFSSLMFRGGYNVFFHSLHSHFLMLLRVSFSFVFRFIFSIQISMGYGHNILMRAPIGCVYVPFRPIPFSCKTDTGHICGMYMWFVDLYIGPFVHCCHLISDIAKPFDHPQLFTTH